VSRDALTGCTISGTVTVAAPYNNGWQSIAAVTVAAINSAGDSVNAVADCNGATGIYRSGSISCTFSVKVPGNMWSNRCYSYGAIVAGVQTAPGAPSVCSTCSGVRDTWGYNSNLCAKYGSASGSASASASSASSSSSVVVVGGSASSSGRKMLEGATMA
jgi:hypothetical protein